MAHSYDTGLAKPQRTLIRDAFITRLSLLKVTTGLYLQGVIALPNRIIGRDDEIGIGQLINALGAQSPAMAVALGRGDHGEAGAPASRGRKTITISVYVWTNNVRGMVEGRLKGDAASLAGFGETKDPGIETMLEHAEQLLVGKDLGIAHVDEVRWQAEDEIYTGEEGSIWEAIYTVRVDRTINHNRLVTQLLTEIETRHNLSGADPANPVYTTRNPVQP